MAAACSLNGAELNRKNILLVPITPTVAKVTAA